jgi:hypothetical protein|tara:strand:+ start:1059 stop:1166 length:108 start_codon:yes stop_codon:yes gene_type:complete
MGIVVEGNNTTPGRAIIGNKLTADAWVEIALVLNV